MQIEPVTRETIFQELSLTATVNSTRESSLSSAVEGLVIRLDAELGDRVEAGAPLVALDDAPVRFEHAAAEARSEAARARLAEAQRLLREARSMRAGRNIAATEVSARESQVMVARANLARVDAERERLSARLERHHIRAPFAGVISQRLATPGEWVTPGDELMRLVDIDNLRIDFQVPQRYLGQVDDQASLRLRRGDRWVEAPIDVQVPVNDPASRTFLLRAHPPADIALYPGTAVDASLLIVDHAEGLTVSRDALNRYPDGRVTVWIAAPQATDGFSVTEKRVRLGISFGNRVEIVDGLDGSERVVTRGNESLTEGLTVTRARHEAR